MVVERKGDRYILPGRPEGCFAQNVPVPFSLQEGNMKSRNGYSMIEMLVVMATGAVVLGIAVALLHTLLQGERAGRERLRRCAVIGRLADQFRRDVHAAVGTTAEQPDDGEDPAAGRCFELTPDVMVVYRFPPGAVTRSELAGAKLRHRESYRLPPGATASVEVRGGPATPVASLVIASKAEGPQPSAARTTQIEAALARDHRFAKANESYGAVGDWSIFRPEDALCRQDVGRKHGPVPFAVRGGQSHSNPWRGASRKFPHGFRTTTDLEDAGPGGQEREP